VKNFVSEMSTAETLPGGEFFLLGGLTLLSESVFSVLPVKIRGSEREKNFSGKKSPLQGSAT
jgi:hypothetical protein